MQVQIVDNVSLHMISVLSSTIEQSKDIRFAVAFVSQKGLSEIESSIKKALQAGAYIEFLVGLDPGATEPKAIETLYQLSQGSPNVALYCYASVEASAIYHPKMYLMRSESTVAAIIGSSNLTEGGLKKNIEVNIVLQASIRDEIVSDIYAAYNRLKFHPQRVIPDEEFLALYSRLCNIEKRRRKEAVDELQRGLKNDFVKKASSLRRPQPTKRDLIGWLELVYDVLPEGEFTNQQVYQHEEEFRRYYPENLNIRAKIRQKLQELRDMGFLQHVGTARWRKV